MNLLRIIELACHIDGWMDTDEMEWLHRRAHGLPDGGQWVEVGCWKGRSFLPTALGMRRGQTIYAVDTFLGDAQCATHWEAREVPDWIFNHFKVAVSAIESLTDSPPRIQIYRQSSLAIAKMFTTCGNRIDGVFIDASHYYPAITSDINAWLPLVKSGGVICGHDSTYPDVRRAIDELLPAWKQGPKTIWYAEVP